MERRAPPDTEEGWYALHDFRRIRWDAWREAPAPDRERALEAGVEYLRRAEDLADAEEGDSAAFSVVGHKADLMLVHLRPTLAAIDRLERQFERTALARFTTQPTSYVSITEVSGYAAEDLSEGLEGVEDAGLRNYLQTRLYPSIPDAAHVSFYPMDKRRAPEYNWYDLPFEERADLMAAHGEIGREYAGDVTQIITGSVGLDDHEWGVTLFADDLAAVKHLLYEMRFDPSSSRYAEFGRFYVGSRFPPSDLRALLAGEPVPADRPDGSTASTTPGPGRVAGADDGNDGGATDADGAREVSPDEAVDAELEALGVDPADWAGYHALVYYADADPGVLREEVAGLRENFERYDRHVHTAVEPAPDGGAAIVSVWTAAEAADTAGGFLAELPGVERRLEGPVGGARPTESGAEPAGTDAAADLRATLADLGIYGGQPHGEDVYALVVYSSADVPELTAAVGDRRDRFEADDAHVRTAVYHERDGDRTAVASIWETEAAAERAGESLSTLPGVEGGPADRDADEDGFATMGMFYTVKPDHREAFVERFDEVAELVDGMEGHRETALLVNAADENDTFVASRWRSREDAEAFFRSDAFAETVSWGREVLADRPRHVFLA